MFTSKGTCLSTAVSGILAAAVAMPVMAQTTEMEEIIVTARKRDESFKDVPVTVNVFTETLVKDAGIYRPADFIQMVPNMTLVETQNAGNAFVVIRGISQARNSEPSVAVQVDGVLQTNPAEFNQELYDIQQIEVLKGPQGALYGRNAIGGAIIITTKDPADEFEATVKAGYGNENSIRGQLGVSGPLGDSAGYRATVNYYETDGFLHNVFLNESVDPVESLSARARFVFEPSDNFRGDFRVAVDDLSTRALYFVVPRVDEANPFGGYVDDANDVDEPIQLDNPGINDRDVLNTSLKLDFGVGDGTFTSVTHYNTTEEVLTGDAFDFRPAANSLFNAIFGFDLNQSQFLDVEAYSQELRYTSPTEGKFRWIAGAYYIHTDRFISTGNMVDTGAGRVPGLPRTALRRQQPERNLPRRLAGQRRLGGVRGRDHRTRRKNRARPRDPLRRGQAREHDRDARGLPAGRHAARVQRPGARAHLERAAAEVDPALRRLGPLTFYGGWSRGFRSGGFNQTGVGAVADASGIAGVNDLFEAEVAETSEVGFKSVLADGRVAFNGAAFYTDSENGYFFVFLAANSTQNLGNLDARYKGFELEMNWSATDNLNLYASYGYTDSDITDMEDPSVKGNEAPLVSRNTANAGFQYNVPVGELDLSFRVDYRYTGRTWWEPYNTTSRDPIDIVDARVALGDERWTATLWGKNLTDEEYNQEFSPGGFLFKALPIRYGIEFEYNF